MPLISGHIKHRGQKKTLVYICMAISLFLSFTVHSENDDSIAIGKTLSPAFQRVFNMILAEAEIKTEIVPAPLGRERKLFEQGIIKIECCVVPEWRNLPGENAVQRFSIPVYVEDQLLVTHATDSEFQFELKHAHSYTLGLIRGFNKDLYQEFEHKVEVNNYDVLFNMLQTKRLDLVLVGRPEFNRQQFVHNDIFNEVHLYTQHPLRIRVHKSVQHLLADIDKAIVLLTQQKQIKPIIEAF